MKGVWLLRPAAAIVLALLTILGFAILTVMFLGAVFGATGLHSSAGVVRLIEYDSWVHLTLVLALAAGSIVAGGVLSRVARRDQRRVGVVLMVIVAAINFFFSQGAGMPLLLEILSIVETCLALLLGIELHLASLAGTQPSVVHVPAPPQAALPIASPVGEPVSEPFPQFELEPVATRAPVGVASHLTSPAPEMSSSASAPEAVTSPPRPSTAPQTSPSPRPPMSQRPAFRTSTSAPFRAPASSLGGLSSGNGTSAKRWWLVWSLGGVGLVVVAVMGWAVFANRAPEESPASLIAATWGRGKPASSCIALARSLSDDCASDGMWSRYACARNVATFASACLAASSDRSSYCAEIGAEGIETWSDKVCAGASDVCRRAVRTAGEGCAAEAQVSGCHSPKGESDEGRRRVCIEQAAQGGEWGACAELERRAEIRRCIEGAVHAQKGKLECSMLATPFERDVCSSETAVAQRELGACGQIGSLTLRQECWKKASVPVKGSADLDCSTVPEAHRSECRTFSSKCSPPGAKGSVSKVCLKQRAREEPRSCASTAFSVMEQIECIDFAANSMSTKMTFHECGIFKNEVVPACEMAVAVNERAPDLCTRITSREYRSRCLTQLAHVTPAMQGCSLVEPMWQTRCLEKLGWQAPASLCAQLPPGKKSASCRPGGAP